MFCKRLNWVSLATIIDAYSKRLYFGVKDELLPLVRISTEVCVYMCYVYVYICVCMCVCVYVCLYMYI